MRVLTAAFCLVATSAILVAAASAGQLPQVSAPLARETPPSRGETIFSERCRNCHEADDDRAPGLAQLATYKPDAIVAALKSGAMAPMAAGLEDKDIQAIAVFLTTPKPVA